MERVLDFNRQSEIGNRQVQSFFQYCPRLSVVVAWPERPLCATGRLLFRRGLRRNNPYNAEPEPTTTRNKHRPASTRFTSRNSGYLGNTTRSKSFQSRYGRGREAGSRPGPCHAQDTDKRLRGLLQRTLLSHAETFGQAPSFYRGPAVVNFALPAPSEGIPVGKRGGVEIPTQALRSHRASQKVCRGRLLARRPQNRPPTRTAEDRSHLGRDAQFFRIGKLLAKYPLQRNQSGDGVARSPAKST